MRRRTLFSRLCWRGGSFRERWVLVWGGRGHREIAVVEKEYTRSCRGCLNFVDQPSRGGSDYCICRF